MNNEEEQDQELSTKPLLLLEDMLRFKIKQKKRLIQNSHDDDINNIAYIESLWTEIRTIQWVLGEILTILNNNSNNKTKYYASLQQEDG